MHKRFRIPLTTWLDAEMSMYYLTSSNKLRPEFIILLFIMVAGVLIVQMDFKNKI